jgi:hypothetical protein
LSRLSWELMIPTDDFLVCQFVVVGFHVPVPLLLTIRQKKRITIHLTICQKIKTSLIIII